MIALTTMVIMNLQIAVGLLEKNKQITEETKKEVSMQKPNGADLLRTLIKLYAEQENVKIVCEIHKKNNNT